MAIFLSEVEGREFRRYCDQRADGARLRDALRRRVRSRLVGGGLGAGPEDWWFCVAEYVTDAAMVFALDRDGEVGEWLRAVMLWLVDRPIEDWVGPAFREHGLAVPVGNLETAHLTWATGVALDLGYEAFSPSERERLLEALRERGATMCGRWLSGHNHLANWRCVLLAGLSVAAVVLGDRPLVDRCVEEYGLCLHVFQPDGSYGESLQYGNYAASAMVLTREALLRSGAADAAAVTASPWSLMPRWQASSLLYQRPVEGWGVSARAVSANFNDSGALFRPSGDLLLHTATRERERTPEMAGLARWLFDRLYGHDFEQAPHNRASFGFLNDFGFLSVPLLAGACSAMEPQEAGLCRVEAFSCGDVLLRDGWGAGRS